MGSVISFSEIQDYISMRKNSGNPVHGVIIDTNVLIAMTYEIQSEHDVILDLIELLMEEGLRLYTTVITRSEFFDFQRRLLMTEGLLDLLDNSSHHRISQRASATINSRKAILRRRVKASRDPVFVDRELKEMKRSFSAGPHSGASGWLTLCQEFLSGKLLEIEEQLTSQGIEYLSPHHQTNVFVAKPSWASAIKIAETTAMSFSDSMILNILQFTKGLIAVSLDFDLGYATLSQPELGDVLAPKQLKAEYRRFHFPIA